MSKDKTVTVEAKVIDARHDFSTNEILVKLDVDGKRMAVRLDAKSIFGFAEIDRDVMKQYAEGLSKRRLPIKLEVLESQMKMEED